MNTFYLIVISSNKVFFDDKVTKFVLPLEDGEMAVLPHHENMIIATSIGWKEDPWCCRGRICPDRK